MTAFDHALRWMDKQPSAVSGSGGHNQTYSVACCLAHGFMLSEHDVLSLMSDYNTRCQPPWRESELIHKIKDACNSQPAKPRGYMLKNLPVRDRASINALMPAREPRANDSGLNRVKHREIPAPANNPMPEPIPDGARALLRAVFHAGEGIRIAHARLNDEDREIPADSGCVLSREEWLRRLDAENGNPNGIWSSPKKTGIYISINPMKVGGDKDSDVFTSAPDAFAFRHALIEFDGLPQQEQWNLYRGSNLPCAAIISSGGKSIHAWVRVDAKDRREYDERVKTLYDYFSEAGHAIDTKNKNPSRFSRLPNCVRFSKRQELLALNVGAESFTKWLEDSQAEGIGYQITVDELLSYKADDDANTVIGKRWLCKGGSCLLIGPSGVGKSSLASQMAATWAIGIPFFGIAPVRPLKSLIVQAENDTGDMAEMVQGVFGSFDFLTDDQDALFRSNLIFVRDTTHTGRHFADAISRLIDKHKPDLVWFDPLLSFIGADISKQEICSEFLRGWLNPISEATGVVWMCVHHTGKPPTDKDARRGWQMSDYGYSGMGSSELTNWARAILVLRAVSSHQFELKLAKRGKRAGATHPDGQPATSLWLQHGDRSICWSQIEPPEESAQSSDLKHGKSGRPKSQWNMKLFLEAMGVESLTRGEIKKRAMQFGGFGPSHFEGAIWKPLKDCLVQSGKTWAVKLGN